MRKQVAKKSQKTPGKRTSGKKIFETSPAAISVPASLQQTQTTEKKTCTCGGFCPTCNEKRAIQPKLKADPANDRYEQEANRIADGVVKPLSEKHAAQNKPVKQLAISTLQREPAEENEEELLPPELSPAKNNIRSPLDELPDNAQSLAENTRTFFETRMGYNFNQVKIHTDTRAARSAQSINALAYTTGNHIVFNRGQYAPDSHAGQHLLAHELTHVVQQRNAPTHPAIQRQTHTPLLPGEETAAANQGVSPQTLLFRADQLIPVSARELNLPNADQDCTASTGRETPQALLNRFKRATGTRYFFMPAANRPNISGRAPDPLQDNGVLLAVECNYLTHKAALVAVASEVINAYVRVPLRTGAAIPASFRRPLVLLYNGGPISRVNNIGNGFGNTTVSIFLRRFGSRGARPVFHEFTHALLNPNRTFWSTSLSEGFASYIQGQFRPGDTRLTFPDVSNPHQCVVANRTHRNRTLLQILGGRGAAPTDRTERKAFYTASWSFVYYLNTHVRVVTDDTRRAAFLNVYQNGEAEYQTEYGRSRESMVRAWQRWVRREGRVRRGQPAPSCKPAIDTQSNLVQATAPSAGAIAQQGFTGLARQLPFLPTLQQAFGAEHKLDQVRAYFDEPAATACHQLNAHAYTVGDRVAFKQTPTLNTVAHEATHVIQQRQGAISPTDTLEQQANHIAAQIERGQSELSIPDKPQKKAAPSRSVTARILQKQAADHIAGYSLDSSVNQDFQDILTRQLEALTAIARQAPGNRGNSEYGRLFEEARAFANAIATQMEALKTTEIRMQNGTDIMSFQRLSTMIDPRTPIWTHVLRLLQNPALAESAALRSMLAQEQAGQSADPFAAFEGRWRGIWYANPTDTRGFANDHDWQATGPVMVGPVLPGPGNDIRIQPVVMGPLAAGEPVRTTGINTTGPAQAAINAVDRSTGTITGAVVTYNGSGENRQRFIRQHVGYFLNNRTLIWVARENTSLRSCFIEHRTTDNIYYIMGLQFNWNSQNQTLSPATVMGGRYTQPQLTR